VEVRRFREGTWASQTDEVAAEEPFEIRVAGRSLTVIMRTPGHDRYLAAGFLVGEGIIATGDDLVSMAAGLDREGFPEPNVLDLRLRPEVEASERLWQRAFPVNSSCGLCGKASIEAARVVALPVAAIALVRTAALLGLEAKLRAAQAVFARTGGLHAAGLFDRAGRLLLHHEDVGRHNAVDKVVGQLLLEDRLPAGDAILLVSGRSSFELLQKAAIAGIPVFVAVGAPSSLAVEMAAASEITLVGLLRPDRFVVYTRPDRIID
jgi:FdhD protein